MLLLTYSSAVLCAVFIITGAVSGGDVKKAVGETVSFRPDKLESSITSFTWKQINSGKVVKAIDWDVDDGFSILNPRFKVITSLDEKTGQITITNLKVEHSGLYTIDINSKEQQQRFTLEVMERVPKPVITIEKSSNPDAAYLRCNYNETIIWKNSAGDTLKGTKNHNPGEFIKVEKTTNPENAYTCTFKNAVSEETSDPVYERDLFKGGGPWWIALIVLVIPILLAASFILPYKFYDPFHKLVSSKCKDKPCIGAILYHLDGKKKALLTSPSPAENGEKTEIALLTSPSPAENGEEPLKADRDGEKGEGSREKTEIDPPKSPSPAENGEKTEIALLTSPSPAENGEEPLKADRDGEKGEGSREKTEIADADKQEGSENSKELHRASESGQ